MVAVVPAGMVNKRLGMVLVVVEVVFLIVLIGAVTDGVSRFVFSFHPASWGFVAEDLIAYIHNSV